MNDENENAGSLSREEKIQQLRSSGVPRINTPKVEDPTRLYTIVFMALISVWGLMDPQGWFFANLGLLVLFMIVRRQSRFQVPWMLEIYPILSITYFILAAYWKRDEIFSAKKT